MQPVTVQVEVPQAIEDVYDFLDVMANHEPFTDHLMRNWRYSGPERGIGSRARVDVTVAGRTDVIDIEVVGAEAPTLIVERNIGAGGRRVANGTYSLAPLPGGGTRIAFEYAWRSAPLAERIAGPFTRAVVRRANERAMRRLADQLQARTGS